MKNLAFVFLLLCCQFGAVAQIDSLAKEDSLRQALETRLRNYERSRNIYAAMYAKNRWNAVDSVNTARISSRNLDERQSQLQKYTSNLRIDTLKEINLSYCGLHEIPDFVFRAKSMEVLILDYNRIKKLPKSLSDLPSLKRIYWRGNQLENFKSIRIQKIAGLERLDISNNQLTRLPIGVKKLEGLKELVAEENFFGEIPVKRLSKADFIKVVSFNKAHDLRIGANEYGKLSFLEVWKSNQCGLSSLDSSFYDMTGLKEIQLQENDLKTIPSGISNIYKLEKLSFFKNKLNALPDDLFDLNLKVIDLYYNDLEIVPDRIGNMSNLEVLFLAHNRIYSLPESIGQLTKLNEFYVHHNRLSVLPVKLSQLKALKIARVNDNYLLDFPDQFLVLPNLEDLDISANQIKTIPLLISNLQHLRLFTYQDNPIDFEQSENAPFSGVIVEMIERGVVCVPRIYKEEAILAE